MQDIIPISVTIVIIWSIYATIKFTVIDIKNGRFGRICNHRPPCNFFANTSNVESEATSIVTSPDYKTKSSSPDILNENIELVLRPRSRTFSGTFPIQNSSDFNKSEQALNCTYNNIIIARTASLKPR